MTSMHPQQMPPLNQQPKGMCLEGGVLELTILGQFGGAHQRGDLERVLADGAAPQTLHALARGRVTLFFQLRLGRREAQVCGCVFQLLGFSLWV